jgi:hypothetical protein
VIQSVADPAIGRQSSEPEVELDPLLARDAPALSAFFVGAVLPPESLDASFEATELSEDSAFSVEDVLSPLASLAPPFSFERAAARELELRSFLAQPLPLKWTDGAEKTFVMDPSAPHSGQK